MTTAGVAWFGAAVAGRNSRPLTMRAGARPTSRGANGSLPGKVTASSRTPCTVSGCGQGSTMANDMAGVIHQSRGRANRKARRMADCRWYRTGAIISPVPPDAAVRDPRAAYGWIA